MKTSLPSCHLPLLIAISLILPSITHGQIAPETCSNDSVPVTTPSEDFATIGDGSIVRHEATGLEWQRCAVGQSWDGSTCQGEPATYIWQGALSEAADAGGEWRLPDINELQSIIERCRRQPAINRQIFPESPADGRFWSASPRASENAWFVGLFSGESAVDQRSSDYHIRLVRDGQ